MLEHAGQLQKVCFRHYGWNENAYTFGYSQSYLHMKSIVPEIEYKLYRRPTGGGILSHTNDWTYSLAIPYSHRDVRKKACEVYRKIHTSVSIALNKQGMATELVNCLKEADCVIEGVCFTKAELFDVIDLETEKKIAGAAMKRNRSGLLLQGSIDKTNSQLNWEIFYTEFTNQLSQCFGTSLENGIDIFLPHPHRTALCERFNSRKWNEKR